MSRRKVSSEKVMEAVRKWLAGEGSKSFLASEIGIDESTFRAYLTQYAHQGISGIVEKSENNVYTPELKRKAVMDYLNGEESLRSVAARYGLRSKKQLTQWIKVYNSGREFQRKTSGGSRMKESRSTTVEERVQIAKDCIANGGNYGETALKYKVSYQQVYQWTKKYKEMGAPGLEDRRGKRKKDQTPRTELEEAQIEIERLKHELYMTQMERDLLKKLGEIERREAYRK